MIFHSLEVKQLNSLESVNSKVISMRLMLEYRTSAEYFNGKLVYIYPGIKLELILLV